MFSLSHQFSQFSRTLLWSSFSFVFLLFIFCFSSVNIAYSAEPTLAWDANTESDLAGYYIYYKTGASGSPYDGRGSDEGDSPIQVPLSYLDDPTNPEFTMYGLSDNEDYFFEYDYDYEDKVDHKIKIVEHTQSDKKGN